MRRVNLQIYWLFLIVLIGSSGCKTLKIRDIDSREELKYNRAVKRKYEETNRPDNILLKNALLKIEDENKTSVRLTIYLEKNKQLFINGRYLGFEIFRIKLSEDSVYFINRISKNYFFGHRNEIRSGFIKELSLTDIQEVIYTGLVFSSDLSKRYIENHFTPDVNSVHYRSFIDEGIKLEMEYDPSIFLKEILYSNHPEKIYLTIDLLRERENLEKIRGTLFRDSNEIVWSLDLKDISYEQYDRTSFKIGNNYNEVKNIF